MSQGKRKIVETNEQVDHTDDRRDQCAEPLSALVFALRKYAESEYKRNAEPNIVPVTQQKARKRIPGTRKPCRDRSLSIIGIHGLPPFRYFIAGLIVTCFVNSHVKELFKADLAHLN